MTIPQVTQHEPFYWWVEKSKIVSEGMEAILVLFWSFFGLNLEFNTYVPPTFYLGSPPPHPPTSCLSHSDNKITTGKILCTSYCGYFIILVMFYYNAIYHNHVRFKFFDEMIVKPILPLWKMLINAQMMQIMYKTIKNYEIY